MATGGSTLVGRYLVIQIDAVKRVLSLCEVYAFVYQCKYLQHSHECTHYISQTREISSAYFVYFPNCLLHLAISRCFPYIYLSLSLSLSLSPLSPGQCVSMVSWSGMIYLYTKVVFRLTVEHLQQRRHPVGCDGLMWALAMTTHCTRIIIITLEKWTINSLICNLCLFPNHIEQVNRYANCVSHL